MLYHRLKAKIKNLFKKFYAPYKTTLYNARTNLIGEILKPVKQKKIKKIEN